MEINWLGMLRKTDLEHLSSKVQKVAQHKPAPTFSSPKNVGIFLYDLGSGARQHVKEKRWKGITQTLH